MKLVQQKFNTCSYCMQNSFLIESNMAAIMQFAYKWETEELSFWNALVSTHYFKKQWLDFIQI